MKLHPLTKEEKEEIERRREVKTKTGIQRLFQIMEEYEHKLIIKD